jgi:Lrp/AsnC family transcriptional regulator, leucine-responsive regulatory protein
MEKLNKSECKVLTILEKDCRRPANQIAKELKLSTEGVIKLIKRLKEKNIISKFKTKINYSKMDYCIYPLHIKLLKLNDSVIKKIKERIKEHKSCAWYNFCEGEYDLLLSFKIYDNIEKEDMDLLISEIAEFISEKETSIVLNAFEISKSFIPNPRKNFFTTYDYKTKSEKLSDDELKLIDLLRLNSRETILNIADKMKTTPRIAMSRLKGLKEKKVITGFKTKLNMASLGYQPCIALIATGKNKPEDYERFFDYCRSTEGIHYLVRQIGKYELELTFDVEGINQFYTLIDDIRSRFPFIKKISTLIPKININ